MRGEGEDEGEVGQSCSTPNEHCVIHKLQFTLNKYRHICIYGAKPIYFLHALGSPTLNPDPLNPSPKSMCFLHAEVDDVAVSPDLV